MPEEKKLREPGPDVVRALAILMVLMIHVCAGGLNLTPGSGDWWGAMLWGSLARPAVPLFFMCSGAMMLDRDIPLKRLYGHNFLRILVAMLCWAFAYRVWGLLSGGLTLGNLWYAVKATLTLQHEFHFYFLHILLLVYAFVPVVRVFVRSASRRETEYLLLVWFITGILFPLLRYFWPFRLVYTMTTNWYVMNMAYSSIGYCVLGWYLRKHGKTIRVGWYWSALAVGFILVFGGTALMSLREGAFSSVFMEGMSPGPLLMAAGIMGLVLRRERWPEKLHRFTGRLAQASFCIYLVHIMVLRLVVRLGMSTTALPILAAPAIVVILTAVGWAIYEILSRIPIVNKWLV